MTGRGRRFGDPNGKRIENDDDDDTSQTSNWRRAVQSKWSAPQRFVEETSKVIERNAADPFEEYRTKRIIDKEDSYRSQWRKRALSPDRVDPFAAKNSSNQNKRTYAEVMAEAKLEAEKHEILHEMKIKERELKLLKSKIPPKQSSSGYNPASNDEQNDKYSSSNLEDSSSNDPPYQRRRISRNDHQQNNHHHHHHHHQNNHHQNNQQNNHHHHHHHHHNNNDKQKYQKDKQQRKYKWGKQEEDVQVGRELEPEEKQQPNFNPSGKLEQQASTVNGIEVKWQDPPEARIPSEGWRLYVFKDDKIVGEPMKLYDKVSFMFGKDVSICDIATLHPSCSKQHAVVVFRRVDVFTKGNSLEKKSVVRPYIVDLKSTNGTQLNGNKIEDSVAIELRHKDVLKFGLSSREYVLLKEDGTTK